jgi:hypothetical protein
MAVYRTFGRNLSSGEYISYSGDRDYAEKTYNLMLNEWSGWDVWMTEFVMGDPPAVEDADTFLAALQVYSIRGIRCSDGWEPEPPVPAPSSRKIIPQVCPEVWRAKPFSPDACREAMLALCRGAGQ